MEIIIFFISMKMNEQKKSNNKKRERNTQNLSIEDWIKTNKKRIFRRRYYNIDIERSKKKRRKQSQINSL